MLGKLLQGRYKIVQVLGGGGFCKTYLAQDLSLANQPACVVKHLLSTSEQPESLETLRELFTREVEALKKLGNYEGVPQILAHFEENQEFYLVQEFILGQTLSAELQPGKRWSETAVMQMLQEVLLILEYVHSHGLIHRDIKPSNLIRRQDGRIVLVDFGAAKQARTQVITAQGKTNTSYAYGIPATIAIGTPGYMPTEQGRGRPRLNSDIYALGVLSIQALTGLNPTQLLEDSDTGEIIWQHHVQATALLAQILTKMVRYHFQERYESATETLLALQPLLKRQAPRHQGKHSLTQRPSTTLVAETIAQKTPDLRKQRSTAHLKNKILTRINNPNNSVVLLGITTSLITLAVIVSSYYFLQSPGFIPVRKPPVVLKSRLPVVASIALNKTLSGHSDFVWSVALSSDGQTLVSGSEDKTIKIWNLDTGQLLRTLNGYSDSVRSVAVSSNGEIIASGSADKTVKLWNLETGVRTFSEHSGPVWSIALSPDGQTLVSGSQDNTIKIWHLPTGGLRRTLVGHSGPVFSVAISPNRQIASAGGDKTIKIWNLDTGQLLRTLRGHSDAVRSVAFSPDRQKLASTSWDKTVKVWDLRTGKVIRTFVGHSDRAISVAFVSDRQIASTSVDKTIKIWDLQTGLVRNLSGHSDWVLSVATSSMKGTLVSGSKDKTIKIWQQLN